MLRYETITVRVIAIICIIISSYCNSLYFSTMVKAFNRLTLFPSQTSYLSIGLR